MIRNQSPHFGGISYDELTLVRVQDSVADCSLDESGALVLDRQGSNRAGKMNTFHFTLNAVVENHVLGKQFDSAFCVIVAPLLRVCREGNNIPSGLLPADTYS